MDVAVQDGAIATALEQLRRRISADALELAVEGMAIAVAGSPPPGNPHPDDLCAGVVVRRWGGRAPQPGEAMEVVAQALAATVRDKERSDDARAAAAAFLGTTTHEVKTPLTVVLGTLRLLQQHGGSVDPEQRALLLSMAARRTRDVARLVDGVLHTARNQLTPDVPRRSRLTEVLADAASGVEFGSDVEIAALPDTTIAVDAATARSAVGNLLDDALTRGGHVTVVATQHDGVVEVTVRNCDRDLAAMRDDPRFEPAAPTSEAPSPTAGLHLAALLCEASGSSLAGGVVGPEAHFVIRFPAAEDET